MKVNMTVDEAMEFAKTWVTGMTFHEGSMGWRVVCMVLAEEVERLRQLEAQRVPEWQPIETAPKPYADVLVKGDSGYAVAFFDPDEDFWVTDYRGKGNWQPVHALYWMPLPAAPAPKEGE